MCGGVKCVEVVPGWRCGMCGGVARIEELHTWVELWCGWRCSMGGVVCGWRCVVGTRGIVCVHGVEVGVLVMVGSPIGCCFA